MSIRNAALVLCAIVPSLAQAMTCSSKFGPAEQIACLQTQNAVLKELIQSRELYKKLDGDQPQRHLALPLVLSIFGVGGKVQAVLSYAGSGGGTLTVSPGSSLPDGWRVLHIGDGRVEIGKGKQQHILLLAGGAPAQTAAPDAPDATLRAGAQMAPLSPMSRVPPVPPVLTQPMPQGDR